MINFHQLICLSLLTSLFSPILLAQDKVTDPHFRSWKDVPEIIESINEETYYQAFEQLHEFTRFHMGSGMFAPGDENEKREYIQAMKQNWQSWWETVGKQIADQKFKEAKVDQKALARAWKFLQREDKIPDDIAPVWIPDTWTLEVEFTNGDYMGREKELWILKRQDKTAQLLKLRGSYFEGFKNDNHWGVTLSEVILSVEEADELLKTICYLHLYAPVLGDQEEKNPWASWPNRKQGLYYPFAGLSLRKDTNLIIWNTKGYKFTLGKPKFSDGVAGRSYRFLSTVFSKQDQWELIQEPTDLQLTPLRDYLSKETPYFSNCAAEVVQLFGRVGGSLEKKALLEWAQKEKIRTNRNIPWELRSDEFGSQLETNVVNFTRGNFQSTLKELDKLGERLEKQLQAGTLKQEDLVDPERKQEQGLQDYLKEMLVVIEQEKDAAIMAFPEPLRGLIIAHRHPNDPDLEHLSAAIERIRKNPDPQLFQQLADELDEGTARMKGLFDLLMLNQHALGSFEPWQEEQEQTAIHACIESLSEIDHEDHHHLLETLLIFLGGGEMKIKTQEGEITAINITLQQAGYSMTNQSEQEALSLQDAETELKRRYQVFQENRQQP